MFKKPTIFECLAPYNFSTINLQSTVAHGVGHGVRLTFAVPGELDPLTTREYTMVAIPVFEKYVSKDLDTIFAILSRLSGKDVIVLNDFDVPWVTQKKAGFPKIGKRKISRLYIHATGQNADDSDAEDDEEDEEDEDDEEDAGADEGSIGAGSGAD